MAQEMVDLEIQAGKTAGVEPPALFKRAILPVTLKFEDVVYLIKPKKSTHFQEKVILNGVNGLVQPGEILAMLGPSGSGKTTLLTALGGRLGGQLGGSITYNNKPFSNSMKRNTGFVTQDDFLYPHLTVTETLVFTALLRLPNTLSKTEKAVHAEAVIKQLELTKCKNSVVGDHFMRGVSGGERRRVSIGQELLVNPSLLLLDEPTSGLDSTTAQRIVSALWDLAIGGRTIVMTIHQPSSRLFYMFHKVMLLSEGNCLYFGKGSEAMDYFSSIDCAPVVAMNPADFLLDLANGLGPDGSYENKSKVKQSLVLAYKQNLLEPLKAEIRDNSDNQHQNGTEDNKKFGAWPTTWWQQFSVLLQRGVKERRHEAFSGLKIGQVVAVALLAGLLWWQSHISHLQDQIGLLFFMSGFWGFFPLFQAIFTFPPERKMLEKERSSGTYRLSSYFMSRIAADLPMELVLPTMFVTITYWMAGLKHTPQHFFHTLSVLLLGVLVAQGMGLALGALVMDQKKATVLASVIMLSFLLAGGYYVQHVPAFIAWIKYTSISNYSYKLLLGSQYTKNETYPCESSKVCLVGDFPSIKHAGLDGQVSSVLALVLMVVGYRVIAYIALMRIGVTKKKLP